jgi:hypothetical protein
VLDHEGGPLGTPPPFAGGCLDKAQGWCLAWPEERSRKQGTWRRKEWVPEGTLLVRRNCP